MPNAVADTSVFIAIEAQRTLKDLPDALGVSAITLGELQLGVLAATDLTVLANRQRTLSVVQQLTPLPIDEPVAAAWALMIAQLRQAARRMPINDSWIAATAIRHGLPVLTQDGDYDDIPGLTTIKF
jgi:predicted nucleic acid-binding protein